MSGRTPGRWSALVALVVSTSVIVAGCGRSASESNASRQGGERELVTTTPAGTAEVDRITWAVYRDPFSLDTMLALDSPENTALTPMCESLLRVHPDGSVGPGLATKAEYPDPRTLVLTLRDDVTFFDGSPMTAEDAAFSLERMRKSAYYATMAQVDTIEASGRLEVTIGLLRPDYWLRDQLASSLGMVVSKRYVQAKGDEYGTPAGGVMCTGPYKLESWKAGDAVSLVRNPSYWNTEVRSLVGQIDIIGVTDEAALTNGLLTGAIDGAYPTGLGGLDQLRNSDVVDVYHGPSSMFHTMIVATSDGPLGDVRVRRALSLALDRQGILDTVYKGAGELSRAPAGAGAWGSEREIYDRAWDELPEPKVDLEAAKRLIAEAGAEGQPIVFATSSEEQTTVTVANAFRTAAQNIGLKPRLKALSATGNADLWLDKKARTKSGVDGFFGPLWTSVDPGGGFYAGSVLPGGDINYSGYRNEDVIRSLEAARATADPAERARLTVEAQAIVADEVPLMPSVAIDTVLVMNKRLTGAPAAFSYMYAPWTDQLGGKG